MRAPLAGWRLPLRLARRDALRHRARALLVVAMIALPVLAVTTADVLFQTSTVSGTESVDRRMGASQALVTASAETNAVQQAPDPDVGYPVFDGDETLAAPSAEQVSSLLDGARLVELRRTVGQVVTEDGRVEAQALEVDLTDPVTDGLARLTSGRLPRSDGEVVVNAALVDDGFRVGDPLAFEVGSEVAGDTTTPVVVGTAESTTFRDQPFVAGPLGSLGLDSSEQSQWLVDGGPVTWQSVQQLNRLGALVASRAVIDDPPPTSEQYDAVLSQGGEADEQVVAVLALIVVMVVLEVVLLAGPAFAVGARKQQRSLALMAASGGTPTQSRRVVLAGAVVLGGTGAVLGVLLGTGLARVLQPVLQRFSQTWFGPFDVPWLHLLAVAAFGLLSAFLAAAVPAVLASRQDVVAVLAGRRGDAPASRRSSVLGAVLLAIGVAASAYGALQPAGGELAIAVGAVPAVLGMILLVPVVLSLVARVAGRLPLTLRYAVRDAHRHRTRTVPAVAAVAATVAGVVALGIGLSSDEREAEETYTASVADGVGVVQAWEQPVRWDALRAAVEREATGVEVSEQLGLSDRDGWQEVRLPSEVQTYGSGSSLGATVLVSDGPVPVGLVGLSDADAARAARALAAGRAVVFTGPDDRVDDTDVTIVSHRYDPETGADAGSERATLPAAYLPLSDPLSGPAAILPVTGAEELGVEPTTVALVVTGGLDRDREGEVQEALKGVDPDASLYVERGFQRDDAAVIAQLVLLGLGGVLMLGGTLTATFLALSDARPDLATLAAVGASPRTRRGVAAAYALVVGGLGALLGAVVGLVPGIAVTWPLTSSPGFDGAAPTGPFLHVPWLMLLALVVVLPLLTALLVGATARSRLPLVSRLD